MEMLPEVAMNAANSKAVAHVKTACGKIAVATPLVDALAIAWTALERSAIHKVQLSQGALRTFRKSGVHRVLEQTLATWA